MDRAARRRVIKGVKVAFDGDYCAVEGIMKNISETGVLLQVKDATYIPDQITIHNELDGYKVDAEVVRRTGDLLGISFVGYAEQIESKRYQTVGMIDEQTEGVSKPSSVVEKPVTQVLNQLSVRNPNRPAFGKRKPYAKD